MSNPPKILAFAGSTRKGSLNKQLLKEAIVGAEKAGARVNIIDLASYPLPLYDGDLENESGLPENARILKNLFIEADGFLIASPEYNSTISGVLKNCIDWISRPEISDQMPLCAFKEKGAALLSASPSLLGGLRGLFALRNLLQNIYVHVLPTQMTLPKGDKAFSEDGSLLDSKQQQKAQKIGETLCHFLQKFK